MYSWHELKFPLLAKSVRKQESKKKKFLRENIHEREREREKQGRQISIPPIVGWVWIRSQGTSFEFQRGASLAV